MKAIVQSSLLIVIGLVLGLGLMEGGLRFFRLAASLQYEPNPWYGWGHRAHESAWRKQDGREVEVKINAHGLRDLDYPYQKPEGAYRILVLGDSFAEAVQVPLAESFPKMVESALASNQSFRSFSIEVINAGTSGYGTDNELLFFRAEGIKYSPDLVLLEFCICNDVRNNWFELENIDVGEFRKPYFTLGSDGLTLNRFPFEREATPFTPIKSWLNRHVRLYPFLREARDRLLMSRLGGAASGIPLDYRVYLKDYPQQWEVAWSVTRGLMKELKREVAASGARLFVMIVPTRFQVRSEDWAQVMTIYSDMQSKEWDLEKPNRLLRRILEEEGVAYVDLLQPFQAYARKSENSPYLVSDGHWNAAGHRLASQILTDELIQRSIVKSEVR